MEIKKNEASVTKAVSQVLSVVSPQDKILPVMLRSDKPLQVRLFKTLLEQPL